MHPPVGEHMFEQCSANGSWLQVGDESTCLIVLYTDKPPSDMPHMQLQLGAKLDSGHDDPWIINGTRAVLCNLTDEQTLYVLKNGIPSSLVEEMIEVGVDNGWKPELVPLTQKKGWPQVYIEPARHFVNVAEQAAPSPSERDEIKMDK